MSDSVDKDYQISIAVKLLQEAEKGFWITKLNSQQVFAIVCIMQVSCDLDFGNPAAGNKKAGSKTICFCRNCMHSLVHADNPDKDTILSNSKTKSMAKAIRSIATSNRTTSGGNQILTKYGYKKKIIHHFFIYKL